MKGIEPERLVFVDESGATTEMTRRYGRAPCGERIREATPAGHWSVLTLLGAMSRDGMLASMTVESPADGDVFLACLDQVLCPALRPGQVVVMDNLSAHQVDGVRQRIEAVGAQLAEEPELQEVIIDGTERRLPRPARAAQQRRYYSGRKKRHGVKNVIVVGKRKVLWCSPTVPARRHDKAVAEFSRLRLPEGVTVLGDSGFEGLPVGRAGLVTPWKRRRGRKLHWKRRKFNRLLARHRIAVEHTLASVKRLRILRDEFRNRRKGMVDEVMMIGCALHNYRWANRHEALAA